jgi:GcrA cell cycle regulator
MSYHTPWADAHSTALSQHVLGGKLSYREIAEALNLEFGTHYSRNAAIGRSGRLGLVNPYWQKLASMVKKPRKPQPYKPRPKHDRAPAFNSAEYIQIECSEIVPRNLTLLELERDDCRWPYGENQDMRFCGRGQLEGSKYCPAHYRLSLRRNG